MAKTKPKKGQTKKPTTVYLNCAACGWPYPAHTGCTLCAEKGN